MPHKKKSRTSREVWQEAEFLLELYLPKKSTQEEKAFDFIDKTFRAVMTPIVYIAALPLLIFYSKEDYKQGIKDSLQ